MSTAPAEARDTLSDATAALPVWLQLQLLDSEVVRLTKIVRRWPDGAFGLICVAQRDRALERRFVLHQLVAQ